MFIALLSFLFLSFLVVFFVCVQGCTVVENTVRIRWTPGGKLFAVAPSCERREERAREGEAWTALGLSWAANERTIRYHVRLHEQHHAASWTM